MSEMISFIKRLCVSTGGQISVSGANLLLSIMMMIKATPEEFGTFAFINIVIFLGFGISNALLSSPLMVALHRNNEIPEGTKESYFMASIAMGLALLSIVFAITYIMVGAINLAAIYGVTALFLFITRLGRTYFYDQNRPMRVLLSDSAYALIVLIGVGIGIIFSQTSLLYVVGVMACGAIISFIVMGRDIWQSQWSGITCRNWKPFIDGVESQGKHALVGVLTTEATGRSHAYIVTAILGPTAFAPIAAATLFFRPVSLVMFSLTQFERARLARLLRGSKAAQAWHTLNFFYIAGALVWLANIALVYIVMTYFAPNLLGDKYDLDILKIGIAFFAFISIFLCLRSPLSALLQANADFKYLKNVTIISSLIAVPIVAIMVIWLGAIWSLAGVAAGELIAAILIFKLASKRVQKT